MSERFDLAGKVVLITGAARGIGFATAQAVARRGAKVVVVDLSQEAADAAAADLGADRAFGIGADVTDKGAMQRAVAAAVERFGGVDVVMANAGIASTSTTARAMASENFERVVEVNLLGVWRTVDAAMPEIIRRRGHVVVVASVYAFINGFGNVPYAMSKAGVEQLGRALRVELRHHGVSVTTCYFGFIDTAMVHQSLDEDPLGDALKKMIPPPLLKRLDPSVAGEAVARGIEKRAPRVIQPKRWTALSVLRGVVNPLIDAQLERDARVQRIVRTVEEREGAEQRTTA